MTSIQESSQHFQKLSTIKPYFWQNLMLIRQKSDAKSILKEEMTLKLREEKQRWTTLRYDFIYIF